MKISINASPELIAFAKSRGQTPQQFLNEALTILEELTAEKPGTEIALYHPRTDAVIRLKTTEESGPTKPKSTVVPKTD